ncbi:hypothetical protein HN011_002464 [Eciton burchellii]|nr:hypothetical protein HN011_002464 [Eciton burchellii]
MLGYIIDGIPHWGLRTNIRVNGVSTKEELRARLENVEHWDRKDGNERDTGRYKTELRKQNNEAGTSGTSRRQEQEKRNCFNCGQPNHISKDCPKRAQSPKCYKCDERGHIASKCCRERNISVRLT